MFIGEYEHSIDLKGRLIMPAKLRDGLGDKFIVTKGLDGCLFAYSKEEWTKLEAKLNSLPLTSKDARMLARAFFAGAIECELDKQGRFLITANLRGFAKIEKDVIITGISTRVEIWSKQKWEEYNAEDTANPDEIAEKLSGIFDI